MYHVLENINLLRYSLLHLNLVTNIKLLWYFVLLLVTNSNINMFLINQTQTALSTCFWYTLLCWIHTRTQAFFNRFVACAFPFFEVQSVLPIDRYQNATSKAISLHELKKVQLQERYTLVIKDSIGHLKTLCMSVLSLAVALVVNMESEWKRYSSSQSDKKKR